MKEVFINKQGVLNQRVEELEKSGEYIQFKFTFKPLPTDVVREIWDQFNDGEAIDIPTFLNKVYDFMEVHPEYAPIISVLGEKASPLDILILYGLGALSADKELCKMIEAINEEGGNE